MRSPLTARLSALYWGSGERGPGGGTAENGRSVNQGLYPVYALRTFKLWEADLVARSQAATTEAERVHAAAAEKIAEANAAEGRLKGAQDELAALFANVKR